jgi:ABC-2 type transport system permease protein
VSYAKAELERKEEKKSSGLSVFAYILPGMASAFLLFLADHSMRDIHREKRLHTLARLQTVTNGVGTFVASKVIVSALTVFLGSVILFGVSTVTFGIDWGSPALVALSCAGYALFAAGFLAMIVALVHSERRSESVNTMLLFAIAFLGGSYFPAEQLPAFMREQICPLMPNYWFIESLRAIAGGQSFADSLRIVLQLGAAGVVLGIIAAFMLRHQLTAGGRA